MSADSQNWTASDLQKALVKQAAKGEVGAPPEILSAPTRQTAVLLANYVMFWDPTNPENPDSIEDDDLYQILFTRLQTLTAYDAVRSGDVSSMRGIAGAPTSERVDAGAFPFLRKVEDLFKPQDRDHMLNLVLYAPPPPVGPTGVGKTDFAYSLIEGAERVHPDGVQVASNNTSDPFENTESWTELKQWLESTDGTKIFLWDEAAQVLMFDDINAGRALSNLIKLLRKYGCHLLLVGHTGKDIPKDVRRMVLFAQKESKKKAVIGAGLEEDNAGWMNVKNVMFRVGNIPATSISYDSLGDKGKFVFDNDGEDDEQVEEPAPQCAATTNAGTQCPNNAQHPPESPLVCVNHRHKADDLGGGDDE